MSENCPQTSSNPFFHRFLERDVESVATKIATGNKWRDDRIQVDDV